MQRSVIRGWAKGRRAVGTLTLLTVAVMAAWAGPAATQEADFEWSGSLAPGDFLEVRGISGDVVASLAPDATASVVARKDGRRSDFEEVRIRAFEEAGGVVICAIYHAHDADADCDGDRDDDDHHHHRHDIRVSVDFRVQVPEGVEFFGSSVSGDVEADGLRSDVEASTVSGDVWVATTGVARGSTVSGSVDVEMGSLDWDRLHFSTVSGDITVRLPEDADADIEFESLSGDFDSDFDLAIERDRDRFVGSEVRAVLGDGGRRLTFQTVSGDVRLRRARPSGR